MCVGLRFGEILLTFEVLTKLAELIDAFGEKGKGVSSYDRRDD